MAGRIKDEDIALVRERSAVEDVIGERVALRNAGVRIGETYPAPLVDLAFGRQRALDAFATIGSG